MKDAFKHDNSDCFVFGDHHHDSYCTTKLTLNSTITVAFANYTRDYLENKNPEQLDRYRQHWDAIVLNDGDFELHWKLLSKLE